MKLPKSYYNWLSIIGSIIAVFFLFLICLVFLLSAIFDLGASYIGLFLYIVLPVLMVIGLLLIPIGMIIKFRRDKKRGKTTRDKFLVLDINQPRHRNALIIVTISTIVLLFLTSLGSYEAFHYTESVEFCGTLCHEVMEPEFVTYQHSAHARVACVECHVGAGTDWYVRSKISGLYQVYSVLTNKFQRPIPTPLHNLRPARETCEKCHWPEKFYSNKLRAQKNFLTDEENTEWDIMLQMKTGPVYSALGLQEGIHWHINPNVKIEYASEDDKKENILWVKYTNLSNGEVNIYKNEEEDVDDNVISKLSKKTMDCIDCHNRPSHSYKMPADYVDNLLISGKVSRTIPRIKYISMEILKEEYPDKETAAKTINDEIHKFYKSDYPDFYKKNKTLIVDAIKNIQESFSLNTFPKMKASHVAYPNHIGHLETNGCFRCHNNTFKSKSGRIISKDCDLCHTIIAQGKPSEIESSSIYKSLEFKHPIDIKYAWKEYHCSECHNTLYP